MKPLEEIIICACGLPEHQIIFRTIDTDDDVYMSIYLCKLHWYKRLWSGLKYILGYTSKYGDFDEIVLTKEHLPKLKKVVKWLETNHNPIK
jgi:hypothetical protein